MVKPTDEGYRESKVFRGGAVKKETPHTVSLIGASPEDNNVVYEVVGVESREAADTLVKQKVKHYVEEGWKVEKTALPSTYTVIAKGKRERQFIINEGTAKDLEDVEKAEEAGEGEEVSVELHVEFHVSKDQFDSDDVSAAINAVSDEAVRDFGDLDIEVETHVLTGSYLKPVSKPGAEGEENLKFGTKEADEKLGLVPIFVSISSEKKMPNEKKIDLAKDVLAREGYSTGSFELDQEEGNDLYGNLAVDKKLLGFLNKKKEFEFSRRGVSVMAEMP